MKKSPTLARLQNLQKQDLIKEYNAFVALTDDDMGIVTYIRRCLEYDGIAITPEIEKLLEDLKF